jgi:hypothetical protein
MHAVATPGVTRPSGALEASPPDAVSVDAAALAHAVRRRALAATAASPSARNFMMLLH